MLANAASLLIPLILTTSPGSSTASLHHDVHAFVTGYNTVPGQTDATSCIAASGADICGRRDAVACPRRISFGTTVEIRGATYVCEDRLAKKYDTRFDISCDKDMACPYQVAGWTTIKVYDDEPSETAAAPIAVKIAVKGEHRRRRIEPTKLAQNDRYHHHGVRPVMRLKGIARATARLASAARIVPVPGGRG